jgi:thymidylate synthase
MYQRSCDVGLGVPFNIASYALLTSLIAHFCGLEVGNFIHAMGDAHVYMDHIGALEEQIKRTPFSFPTLKILKPKPVFEGSKSSFVDSVMKCLEQVEFSDLELIDYNCHSRIQMEMSV